MPSTNRQTSYACRRATWRLVRVSCLVLALAGVTTAYAQCPTASSPNTKVSNLRLEWKTDIADGGPQKVSTVIRDGTMYLATPREAVPARDASDGKLRRQTPYKPKYVLLYAVDRGVGLADGEVVVATPVAIGYKAGNFVLLDRKLGKVLHRLALSDQAVPSLIDH
jgi:outer membrane protein assembly factor BamB